MKCALCAGNIETIIAPYAFKSKTLGEIVIPELEYDECQECSERLLSPESANYLIKYVEEQEASALSKLPAGDLITAIEAAVILNVTKQAFSKNRKIQRGFIYSVTVGGRKLYSRKSTELYAEGNDGRFRLSMPSNPKSKIYVVYQTLNPESSSIYGEGSESIDTPPWCVGDDFFKGKENAYR